MTSPGDGPYAFPLGEPVEPELARRETDSMVQLFEDFVQLEDATGRRLVRPVLEGRDVQRAQELGQHAALLHFEGAEAIESDARNLECYYERGLRSLGLVWSRPNVFGIGVPFAFPQGPDQGTGLTAAGRELVRRCNALGIVVDLSHLNAAGFWDALRTTRAPPVVTHAAAHRLSAKPRNLFDEQIVAVGRAGGVIGLNFNCADVRSDGRWLAETPIDDLRRHLEVLLELSGEDSVALGSDFDGALMPKQLGDAAGLPELVECLRMGGWSEELLHKVCWKNWQRILEQTL